MSAFICCFLFYLKLFLATRRDPAPLCGASTEQHRSGKLSGQVRNVVLERRTVVQRFLGHKPLAQCVQCCRKQPSLNDFMGQIVKIEKKDAG